MAKKKESKKFLGTETMLRLELKQERLNCARLERKVIQLKLEVLELQNRATLMQAHRRVEELEADLKKENEEIRKSHNIKADKWGFDPQSGEIVE